MLPCPFMEKKMDFITLLCMICKDINESVELRKGHAKLCNYYIYFVNDSPMKGTLRKIRGDQLLTPNIYQAKKLKKRLSKCGAEA